MSGSRIGGGLRNADQRWPDSQAFAPDADYVRKGAYFQSLTGVAITRMGNGDWFYNVTTASTTVTLPAVADETGHHHIVKYTASTGSCNIVAAEGTAILDGSATHSIAAQYGVRCYFSDGDAWRSTGANAGGSSGEITSGVYTASVSLVTNVTAASVISTQFTRVSSVVTVSGALTAKATALAASEIRLTLPIATSVPDIGAIAGAGAVHNTTVPLQIFATTSLARIIWTAPSSATQTQSFILQYRIV